jgi:hypothetical protein
MPKQHFLPFHNRQYQVTPGGLRALAQADDPTDEVLLYNLLRAQGYPMADLDATVQTALWPKREQLALFDVDMVTNPWRKRRAGKSEPTP